MRRTTVNVDGVNQAVPDNLLTLQPDGRCYKYYNLIDGKYVVDFEKVCDALRRTQSDLVYNYYLDTISSDLIYMDHEFDMSSGSITTINQYLAIPTLPEDFTYRSVANVDVPMTRDELSGLLFAYNERMMVSFRKLTELKQKIKAESDPNKIALITWDA